MKRHLLAAGLVWSVAVFGGCQSGTETASDPKTTPSPSIETSVRPPDSSTDGDGILAVQFSCVTMQRQEFESTVNAESVRAPAEIYRVDLQTSPWEWIVARTGDHSIATWLVRRSGGAKLEVYAGDSNAKALTPSAPLAKEAKVNGGALSIDESRESAIYCLD